MTRDEAIAKYNTGWWKTATPKQIVDFQLYEPKLCIDFGDFHKAIETVLGRSVWTHEFGNFKALQAEYEGKQAAPDNPLASLEILLKDRPNG